MSAKIMLVTSHLSLLSITLFSALPVSRGKVFTPWLELPPEVWKLYLGIVFLQIIYLLFNLVKSDNKTQTSQSLKPNFFQEPQLPSRKQKRWILILVRFLNLNFFLLLLLPLISSLFV